MNIVEQLREESLKSIFKIKSFNEAWDKEWKKEISKNINKPSPGLSLINLGDQLRNVFLSTREGSKRSDDDSQGSANRAGAAWEALICWYINACAVNSRLVAIRTRSLLPSELRESIQVNYWNSKTNSESDLVCIIFPEHLDFQKEISDYELLRNDGSLVKAKFSRTLSKLCAMHIKNFELGIIQLKTNWNENAQIPMLWDLIYNNPINHISVGTSSYTISDLNKFTYSFITVPTNKLEKFDKNSLPVLRVRNISGGNYWGTNTKNHVADSIKEIFNRNFRNAFESGVKSSIDQHGHHIYSRAAFNL